MCSCDIQQRPAVCCVEPVFSLGWPFVMTCIEEVETWSGHPGGSETG